MTTETGLPRIPAAELRIRAMAHYEDVTHDEVERSMRFRVEHTRAQQERADQALRHALHLDADADMVWTGDGDDGDSVRDWHTAIDGMVFRVHVNDSATYPEVFVTLPCGGIERPSYYSDPFLADHDHEWAVESPARLGELLIDPPKHAHWEAYQAAIESAGVALVREYPTPEQNLLDAIRLFIRNEMEGD